ncbi:MAG: toll/interleukin-1 receptor domain-containing protein [Ferruginibacter sp.]
MELISEISIQRPFGNAFVQLLHGDLSAIPEEHETDILVISAYPGDYTPLEGSLMGALFGRGLDVEELSLSKAVDLRSQLHCWLSMPLSKEMQDQLNVKRLLCFEPGNMLKNSQEVVGNIFRCINAFAFEEQNNVVALPIVAAGRQKVPLEIVFPVLVDAAIFWLENGLPLQCIKLVVYREEQVPQALKIFEKAKRLFEQRIWAKGNGTIDSAVPGGPGSALQNTVKSNKIESAAESEPAEPVILPPMAASEHLEKQIPMPPPQEQVMPQAPPPAPEIAPARSPQEPQVSSDEYDYFISYAHTHSKLINSFVDLVKSRNGRLNIFYDRDSIPAGSQWIRQLSGAIQKAKKVLIFLSPDYDKSPVCWDEFQCAKLMEYNRRQQIIQTIYLYDYREIEMPPIMGIYSYIDCREGDEAKLEECIQKIINSQ